MTREVAPGTPTQLAHKAQAVKRTVAAVVAGLIVLNGVVALFVEVFDVYLGDVHLGWVAGASAFVAAVIAFLQRLLLVEGWMPFLEKIGLGTGVEDEVTGPPVVGRLSADDDRAPAEDRPFRSLDDDDVM